MSSCSQDPLGLVASRGVRPANLGDDPIEIAIWEIQSNCPGVGDALLQMWWNGDIYYTDVMGEHDDIGWGYEGGPIELDENYFYGASASEILPHLMHEAGHAVGGLYDYPSVEGELHYNDYDFACPGWAQ